MNTKLGEFKVYLFIMLLVECPRNFFEVKTQNLIFFQQFLFMLSGQSTKPA